MGQIPTFGKADGSWMLKLSSCRLGIGSNANKLKKQVKRLNQQNHCWEAAVKKCHGESMHQAKCVLQVVRAIRDAVAERE